MSENPIYKVGNLITSRLHGGSSLSWAHRTAMIVKSNNSERCCIRYLTFDLLYFDGARINGVAASWLQLKFDLLC